MDTHETSPRCRTGFSDLDTFDKTLELYNMVSGSARSTNYSGEPKVAALLKHNNMDK